jgi:hypothetical protein
MKHTRSKLRGIVRLIHSFAASCGEFDPPWIKFIATTIVEVRQPHKDSYMEFREPTLSSSTSAIILNFSGRLSRDIPG